MKKSEKKWIMLLIGISLVIILIIGLSLQGGKTEEEKTEEVNEEKYTTELSDGTKINTSEELNKEKTYGNLKIGNIQYTEQEGMSVLLTDVTNTGSTKHEMEIVKITIIGENDEVITEINAIIEEIEPGETVQLNASITADVSNAKDFKIEAVE